MLGMGRASVGALLIVLAVLAPAATAQSCGDELPTQLVGNYSGLACAPVWNNFVLRVRASLATSASIREFLAASR